LRFIIFKHWGEGGKKSFSNKHRSCVPFWASGSSPQVSMKTVSVMLWNDQSRGAAEHEWDFQEGRWSFWVLLWVDNHVRTLLVEAVRSESHHFTQSAGERRGCLAGSAAGTRCVRGAAGVSWVCAPRVWLSPELGERTGVDTGRRSSARGSQVLACIRTTWKAC